MSLRGALLVAQAGGPSCVINSSLYGVIAEAGDRPEITALLGARHGIEGVLKADFIDLAAQDPEDILGLKQTPAAALGGCRRRLNSADPDDGDIRRLLAILARYDVRYFIYNGGNDSMDTALKVHQAAVAAGYKLRVMGVPKTVDNDLVGTDYCPGYGSAGKYLATIVREAALHNESMFTSEPVTILVTVGRNAGWLPAACSLARRAENEAPHIICFPEVPFRKADFLAKVNNWRQRIGGAFIVSGEGLVDERGDYVMVKTGGVATDGFGHPELGAVGDYLKALIEENLGLKTRVIVPDISQQAAMHCAAAADVAYAELAGRQAVKGALEGLSGLMSTITVSGREIGSGYVPLATVANAERPLPPAFIDSAGDFVSGEFFEYIRPFIQGTVELPCDDNGLPLFVRLRGRQA